MAEIIVLTVALAIGSFVLVLTVAAPIAFLVHMAIERLAGRISGK